MNLVVGRNGAGKTAFLQELTTKELPHAWVGPERRPRESALRGALAEAAGGLMLVDEFENGLHYTVHLQLWRDLFREAELRNVQVFASTHSWDCIRGFTIATQDDRRFNAHVIRLSGGAPEVFSRSEMMAAVRERIEVR